MAAPRRATALVLALGLPLAGLMVTSAQAAGSYSGPYVKDSSPLGGPTGTVLGIAHLRDDSVFLASVPGGTGMLDIMEKPGNNIPPVDDSVTFAKPVLGVGVNQIDDTIYAVTSDATPRLVVAALRDTTIDDTVALSTGSGGLWADVAINNADDTVYVVSQDDTRLYALNGANLDDSRSVPLFAGLTPRAIVVDQDDDTVYVLSSDDSETSRITAMRGSNLDDSVFVNIVGVRTYLQSLAVNQVDGRIYLGGRHTPTTEAQLMVFRPTPFTAVDARTIDDSDPIMGLDVSADGRRLYATTSGGDLYLLNTANLDDSASRALGRTDTGGVTIDDYGWAWTARPGSMAGSRYAIQIGTAPTFTGISPASGPTAGGYTATITGSWFTAATIASFGLEANVGTPVGVPTSNSMTVTVPSRAAGAATLILTNVAGYSQPLGINNSGSFTYVNPPPPTYPPSPPLDVTAVAGDASATVAWTAPASPGSFPVSNYSVTASPGGKTCLTSVLTCEVTGLTNGT
ncbi:MAG: IPT/TIG domain-containing protein, partial [Actinomycetota bacterium]